MTQLRPSWIVALALLAAALLAVVGAGLWLQGRPRVTPRAFTVVAPPPEGYWFAAEDLAFEHTRNGEIRVWAPEVMGGGVGLFDHDGDGDLDLYLVQSGNLPVTGTGPGNRLYENAGGGTFQDVTEKAGVGDNGYGMGCACGDYDGDGDVDLYLTNVGANVLYRNEGDGTFTDITAPAGVGNEGWGVSAGFLDHDRDGDLDLFVVNYLRWSPDREADCFNEWGQPDYCSPIKYEAPAHDVLYRNDGNGTFTDVSREAGLRSVFGNGLGLVCADFDDNGWLDVYVANDATPNQLWLNDGDGTFTDQAMLYGCAVNYQGVSEAGMGIGVADLLDRGRLDLFVTHMWQQTNTLYINEGGLFEDRTNLSGLAAPSRSATGFGTGFADFDLDGELDVYVGNGRVAHGRDPYAEDVFALPDQLFRGLGGATFEEIGTIPEDGRWNGPRTTRGVAFGDLDDDGDIDLVLGASGGGARILRNVAPRQGGWIAFRVLGAGGRDAHGALVSVTTGDRTRSRLVHPTYSYASSNDPRAHFGLGAAETADEVTVRWEDGSQESFGSRELGRVHELGRGQGMPR